MAKPRKNYSYRKRPVWQWIIFYLLIAGVIYSILYYSGILNGINLGSNPSQIQEVEYFE